MEEELKWPSSPLIDSHSKANFEIHSSPPHEAQVSPTFPPPRNLQTFAADEMMEGWL